MPFSEPEPELVTPQPGGHDDPLGESVAAATAEPLRVFAPRDLRIVIGRHQQAAREVQVAAARADGVPIHRRISGGGAVVLAPGMLVLALRRPAGGLDPNRHLNEVAAAVAAAVADAGGPTLQVRGHGDLALAGPDSQERKVLGASLRIAGGQAIYLGVLLVEDAVPLMERYLAMPSRQPDYRAGRGHRDFCSSVGRPGLDRGALAAYMQSHARALCP